MARVRPAGGPADSRLSCGAGVQSLSVIASCAAMPTAIAHIFSGVASVRPHGQPFDQLAAASWSPFHATAFGELHARSCLDVLKEMPADSVSLTVTSPPYERQPKYGNGERYERDWFEGFFLEVTKELLRVTKPDGQFVLNFRSRRLGAERSVLQYELVMWLREQGWLFAEDHVWVKPSPPPGRYKQAVKDQLEYCFRFAKSDTFALYPEQLLQPARWDAKDRARRRKLPHNFERVNSAGGQGRKRVQAGPDWVAPGNALVTEPEFSPNPTRHPARFPPALPEYFIKLCTRPGDVVLDVFAGTCTTAVVAEALERSWIMCELDESYCDVLVDRLVDLSRRLATAPVPDPKLVPKQVRWVPLPFALKTPQGLGLEDRNGDSAEEDGLMNGNGSGNGVQSDEVADRVDVEELAEVVGHEDSAVGVSHNGSQCVADATPAKALKHRQNGNATKTPGLLS